MIPEQRTLRPECSYKLHKCLPEGLSEILMRYLSTEEEVSINNALQEFHSLQFPTFKSLMQVKEIVKIASLPIFARASYPQIKSKDDVRLDVCTLVPDLAPTLELLHNIKVLASYAVIPTSLPNNEDDLTQQLISIKEYFGKIDDLETKSRAEQILQDVVRWLDSITNGDTALSELRALVSGDFRPAKITHSTNKRAYSLAKLIVTKAQI